MILVREKVIGSRIIKNIEVVFQLWEVVVKGSRKHIQLLQKRKLALSFWRIMLAKTWHQQSTPIPWQTLEKRKPRKCFKISASPSSSYQNRNAIKCLLGIPQPIAHLTRLLSKTKEEVMSSRFRARRERKK